MSELPPATTPAAEDEWPDDDDDDFALNTPLAERLRLVMQDIGPIEKEGNYSAGNVSYKFRGIEQITPRVRDAMIARGVVCLPVCAVPHSTERTFERGDGKAPQVTTSMTIVMTYRFMSSDDAADYIDAQTVAFANDTGDKAVTKALTSAFKYLMLQSFCIGDPNDDQDRYGDDDDAHSLSADDITALRIEWPATEDEVGALRIAAGMLGEFGKQTFSKWWTATGNVGNLREGRVNARYMPAAMGVVQALLDMDNAAPDAANDEPS